MLGSKRVDLIHTQIECRAAGVSGVWWYWFGCRRIVDVADLGGKELVKLLFIFTVGPLSLFFPWLSKTSCIGGSVDIAAFDKKAEGGGSGFETGAMA